MRFEYIRSIPSSVLEQEPVRTAERLGDAPDLAELLAHVRALVPDDAISLACPVPSDRVELPRFAGISLADMILEASAFERQSLSVTASLSSEPRVLLGPGAMTMTLAIMATLAFGVFVVTH